MMAGRVPLSAPRIEVSFGLDPKFSNTWDPCHGYSNFRPENVYSLCSPGNQDYQKITHV